MPTRKENYDPTIPRNYDECSVEHGQRAINRHHDPMINWRLTMKRKSDGRLCVLYHIAEHGTVDDKTFKQLTRERRTMK